MSALRKLALLLILLAPLAARAQDLLPNGGLEDWADATAVQESTRRENGVPDLKLDTAAQWPRWWAFGWQAQERGAQCTGEIARDETVRHGGKYSVRMTNRSASDITLLYYRPEVWIGHPDRLPIKPNMRYLLRWWVKGQDVETGAGTALMLGFFLSQPPGGPEYRTNFGETGNLPRGTFDWQPRQVTFVTGPEAKWLGFSLQLRGCKGTAWYDDAELIEDLPVTPVDVY